MEFDDDEDDNPGGPNDREETNPLNNFENPTMVIIRDSSEPKNDLSIFPPINHENLHFSLPPLSSSSSSSSLTSTSLFSPSDSDQSDPDIPTRTSAEDVSDWRWWFGIGFEALRSKALRFVSSWLGGNGVVWWKATGIVLTVMIWSFWIRARHRRRVEDLMSVVRTKEEKINRLLHQIAQLNEVLITRHRVLASKLPN